MQTANDQYQTIFWPSNIRKSGTLIGWRHAHNVVVVAATLPQSVGQVHEASILAEAASGLRSIPYGGELAVLGLCMDVSVLKDASPRFTHDKAYSESIFVEFRDHRPFTEDPSQFVLYDPPNGRKLRYLSTTPITLRTSFYTLRTDENSVKEAHDCDVLFTKKQPPSLDFEPLMGQLNATYEVQRYLHFDQRQNAAVSDAATSTSFLTANISKLFPKFGHMLLLAFIRFLNFPLFGSNSLKDMSAAAYQMDVRLRQAQASPTQFALSRKASDKSLSISSSRYISLYNMLWLIANDVIIGSAVRSFLCEHAEQISDSLSYALKEWSVRLLQDTLLWLNNWPAGLKLNLEVGTFFCDAFLWFTSIWEQIVLDRILLPNLPVTVHLVGVSATVGTTMALAIASDILSLATFHLYVFYMMATTVFAFHVNAMASLFNIFRGRKFNIIRQRIEPSDYTLDQLLIGAVLFTLAAFLIPTVLVFYLTFASSRCCILALHATLEAILAFLNHFPLFALMLRVKDAQRLPGGLAFEPQTSGSSTYLRLKSTPVSTSLIFHEYWALWSKFSQHYSPLFILGKVLSGRYINPIPRSRLTFNPELERPSP